MGTPKFHVAIVDDDKSVRKALTRLLSAHSFQIEAFGSAYEFLSSLNVHTPDCLILDLHMPEFTGLDLQDHMLRSGIAIPTIVITAHNETGLRERCQAAGAKAFLAKPLNGPTLIDVIKAVIPPPDNAGRNSAT